jgi:hypothetical protein
MAYELGSAITPTSGGGGYVKLGMLVQNGFSAGQATSLMTLFTRSLFYTAVGMVTAGWRFVTFYLLLIFCATFFLLLNPRIPQLRQKKSVVANQLAG